MRYYIWIDEKNKTWSRPKPFEVSKLQEIFKTEKGLRNLGRHVALAIGSKEHLEQAYEMFGGGFKESEIVDGQ